MSAYFMRAKISFTITILIIDNGWDKLNISVADWAELSLIKYGNKYNAELDS